MKITFKIWRQSGPNDGGGFKSYSIDASEHMSFLEAIDVVNENASDPDPASDKA